MNSEKITKTVFTAISAVSLGFIEAILSIYTRRIIPMVQWNSQVKDIKSLTKLLNDQQLLWTQQAAEIASLLIIVSIAFAAGKDGRQRAALLMLAAGLWKLFKTVFMFIMIGWPGGSAQWEIVTLWPAPCLAPVYLSVLMCLILLVIAFILLKEPQKEEPAYEPAVPKKKKSVKKSAGR